MHLDTLLHTLILDFLLWYQPSSWALSVEFQDLYHLARKIVDKSQPWCRCWPRHLKGWIGRYGRRAILSRVQSSCFHRTLSITQVFFDFLSSWYMIHNVLSLPYRYVILSQLGYTWTFKNHFCRSSKIHAGQSAILALDEPLFHPRKWFWLLRLYFWASLLVIHPLRIFWNLSQGFLVDPASSFSSQIGYISVLGLVFCLCYSLDIHIGSPYFDYREDSCYFNHIQDWTGYSLDLLTLYLRKIESERFHQPDFAFYKMILRVVWLEARCLLLVLVQSIQMNWSQDWHQACLYWLWERQMLVSCLKSSLVLLYFSQTSYPNCKWMCACVI